ncbi:Solute carrier organic anion transporter family member [Gryllus bimaculatus]|nr:Solute carrier organic anion transporter family member [Gryllus bimaculatus]
MASSGKAAANNVANNVVHDAAADIAVNNVAHDALPPANNGAPRARAAMSLPLGPPVSPKRNVQYDRAYVAKATLAATTPEQEHELLEELYREHPLTDDTSCGIGPCRAPWMQKFANKKAFVFLYGLLGCIFSASHAYFNGTITTLEKRFKIPSRTTGIISVGNDISQLLVSVFISYYAGRRHRPRWIALGIYTVVLFCVLTALPHALYGPGEDALALTLEHGGVVDRNLSLELLSREKQKTLCKPEGGVGCEEEDGNYSPVILLFVANFVSGIGGSLYYTLGVTYMDDNIKKSKTPALISFSYFIRMLGPAIGYSLASVCLKLYISPTLTPTIKTDDPRWLGAWWLGWIILACILFTLSSILGLFPKSLPRAAVRRMVEEEKKKLNSVTDESELETSELPTSLSDMITTFKRLVTNPTLMCNNLAAVFYFTGYMPYWIFMPKYIETMYRQSASVSSLVTGTVGLVFSAVGILLSGMVISKFRPRARYLAGWNVVVGAISVLGMISYVFLGCPANDNHGPMLPNGELNTVLPCNTNCSCDYVKYSPVCYGQTTFISPCHAGCTSISMTNGTKMFTQCSCVPPSPILNGGHFELSEISTSSPPLGGGSVKASPCPVDCQKKFYIFLAVVCLLKFSGATGRASNFLVSVRCVEEKDKPVAMAFGLTIMSFFAFIPSPIFFGFLLDKTCLVWGKTCSGTGNCWLYNGESLRYMLNLTAASFVTIGTLFDAGVWYFVKNLKIFDDDDVEAKELEAKEKMDSKEELFQSNKSK